MRLAMSIVGVMWITKYSSAASNGSESASDNHRQDRQAIPGISSLSSQVYRRPLSLGAPAAAVRRNSPQIPVQPNEMQFWHISKSSQPSSAKLQNPPPLMIHSPVGASTTSQTTSFIHRNDRKRGSNGIIASTGIQDSKGKKPKSVSRSHQVRHLQVSVRPRVTKALLPAHSGTKDTAASSSSTSHASPRRIARILGPVPSQPIIQGQMSPVPDRSTTSRDLPNAPVDRRENIKEFITQWQRKGLSTHLSPKDLAFGVWSLPKYREEPIAIGRYVVDMIKKTTGNDHYVADYKAVINKLTDAQARQMRTLRRDASTADMDHKAMTHLSREKAMQVVSKQGKTSGRPLRPSEIKMTRHNAHTVGRALKAQVRKQGLDLHQLSLEEIEKWSRELKVDNMKPKKATIALFEYLRLTRGTSESELNVFRRNRKIAQTREFQAAAQKVMKNPKVTISSNKR